jgi:hypothetical protein
LPAEAAPARVATMPSGLGVGPLLGPVVGLAGAGGAAAFSGLGEMLGAGSGLGALLRLASGADDVGPSVAAAARGLGGLARGLAGGLAGDEGAGLFSELGAVLGAGLGLGALLGLG